MKTILQARLIRGYQTKASYYDPVKGHTGEDRAFSYEDLPAPVSGVVVKTAVQNEMGKVMYLKHKETGDVWVFAHLNKFYFGLNDEVERGQIIAQTGNTGSVTSGPHLHYECITEEPVNPEDKIMKRKLFDFSGYNTHPERRLLRLYERYGIDPHTLETISKDLQKGYDFLIENELVNSSLPKDVVTVDMLGTILQRYNNR